MPFAQTEAETAHISRTVKAIHDITISCTEEAIPCGSIGVTTDAHDGPEGDDRICVLWEKHTYGVWCSLQEVIECVP